MKTAKRQRRRVRQPHPSHQALQAERIKEAQELGLRTPKAVNCPVCRPAAKKWDRSQGGKAV